jgi:murein DD-endopeptidase MepM/ murein hydrolase activator NlpD
MKNRRFFLVIMDSTGRWVKRVSVSRRRIEVAVLAASFVFVVSTAMLIHGLARYDDAAEAQLLQTENEQLTALLSEIEGRVPALRRANLRASVSFDQLWAKSRLGVEPSLLAAGPTEEDDSAISNAGALSGDVLALDPIALPLETERIDEDGTQVQYGLSQLLEYFQDAERVLQHTPSVRPTRGTWITSGFGRRRDPIFNIWLMHKGLDIGGQTGMEITCPADGVVIFAERRGGYGMTVVIHHGFGLQTHYAHLSRYSVRVGQRVQRGEVIALMGSTGKSTGPHLHYEVRRNGEPLDPARFILD